MFRQTLRSLAAHKRRFVATAIAVVLGVAFMSGTLVLTDTLQASFDGLYSDLNEGTDAYVRASREIDGNRDRIDLGLADTIARLDGVRATAPIVEGYAQLVGPDGKAVEPAGGTPALGFAWIADHDINPYTVVFGTAPSGPDQIVIDQRTAATTRYEPGAIVTVLTQTGSEEFTVSGIVAFDDGGNTPGATLIGFDLPTAMEHLAEPGRIDAVAVASTGPDQQALRDRIADVVPSAQVLTGAQITKERQDEVRDNFRFLTTFLLAFAAIALFVGAFIIHNTFSIVVAQRTKELALLRSLGAGRGQIMGSVVGEAIGVGMLSSAVGIGAGIGVAAGLKALFAAAGMDIGGDMVLRPASLLAPFLIGVAVCAASSILPARKATAVPPIAAMRDVALESGSPSKRRLVIGSALVVLGATAVGGGLAASVAPAIGLGALAVIFGVQVLGPVIARWAARLLGAPAARFRGVSGRIARDNAARNPKRTAATASALMIGVSLVGFASIVAASAKEAVNGAVEQSVIADLIVNAGRFSPGVSPTVAVAIGAVPGVEAVSPIRYAGAEVNGSTTPVVAYDPTTVERLMDLDVTSGSLGALGDNGIAVQSDTATHNGWALGDRVAVGFPTGPVDLTIVALYDAQLVSGDYVVGLDTFSQGYATSLDQQILVRLAPGSEATTRAAIDQTVADFPTVRVMDRSEFSDEQASQIDQFLAVIYALLGLAILIALVGIVNTLSLSIHERTRELGLLRAVGMSRRQLRATVRWEAIIIATFGTLLGLGLGVGVGSAAVSALGDTGIERIVVPSQQLVTIALLGALAGVAAATLPARRAARLDVLTAISTG